MKGEAHSSVVVFFSSSRGRSSSRRARPTVLIEILGWFGQCLSFSRDGVGGLASPSLFQVPVKLICPCAVSCCRCPTGFEIA